MQRVGIFSGTFDPVHAGHIAFALQSLEVAGLDKVYFLPEALPRRKVGVTHYAHRLKMLEIALRPYSRLGVLEFPDKRFSVSSTMPRLMNMFNDTELFMLIGSDTLGMMDKSVANRQWPGLDMFLKVFRLIVGVRDKQCLEQTRQSLNTVQSNGLIVTSEKPFASSSQIRNSLMNGEESKDVLASLRSYIGHNWLYVSVEPNSSR